MIRSLWIAKTGLDAQQTQLDTITHNLANVSTVGYKRSHAVFEDLLYQNMRQAGAQSTQQTQLPTGLQLGVGVRTVATARVFTQGVLQQFCCLFALSRLEVDRAWFLENGYFEGAKSKAIRSQVLELCKQTRAMAWDVVCAFGIPDKLISAPIGLGDYPAPPVAR